MKNIIVFLAVSIVVFISSCKKEESDNLSSKEEELVAMESATAESETEFVYDDAFDNALGVNNELGIAGVGVFGKIIGTGRLMGIDTLRCFTISITPLQIGVFPKTVVLDFGAGCYSRGHMRSGKIKTVYTGRLTQPGSSATTTFENFKIDSISVEGTQIIANTTTATSTGNPYQRQFDVTVADAKLTRPNGNYTLWNSHRLFRQIEGTITETHQDDIFSITGSARGRVKNNTLIFGWNSEITEPLIKRFICRWISKGRVRTIRENLATNSPWVSVLDYGNGDCDNKAVITVNGISHQITLH